MAIVIKGLLRLAGNLPPPAPCLDVLVLSSVSTEVRKRRCCTSQIVYYLPHWHENEISKGRRAKIKEERGAGEPQCRGIDWRVHDYTLQLDPTRMSYWPFEILIPLWEALCLKSACATTWVTWRRNQSPRFVSIHAV